MKKLLGMMVVLFGTGMVLNMAFDLMAAADDVDFVLGVVMLLALASGWGWMMRKVWRTMLMNMRTLMLAGVATAALLGSVGCGTTVPPGYVGLKINSYGSSRGVSDIPIVSGMVWYFPMTTSVISYPTYVQTATWTASKTEGNPVDESISFNTADSMVVHSDVTLAYELAYDKAASFYIKFRADDIGTWTHGYLRNLTREKFDNVAGKYTVDRIMGDNAPFLAEARAAMQKELDPFGVKIIQLGFSSSPRPPQPVIDAINEKVRATQIAIRVENELRTTQAEVQKQIAMAEGQAKAKIASAEGDARANAILGASITDRIMEWKRNDLQWQMIGRWNGSLPQTQVTGGGDKLLFTIK